MLNVLTSSSTVRGSIHFEWLVRYLAFVHVQRLCSKRQLSLRSTDGALQEALLFLKLPHHLQLCIDLASGHSRKTL